MDLTTHIEESSKRSVEKKAINFVVEYERARGNNLIVLLQNQYRTRVPSDKQIEVKGRSSGREGTFVLLNENNITALQKQKNWYLYIVYDLKEGRVPKLRILTKARY
jgi:hypothetical protein